MGTDGIEKIVEELQPIEAIAKAHRWQACPAIADRRRGKQHEPWEAAQGAVRIVGGAEETLEVLALTFAMRRGL